MRTLLYIGAHPDDETFFAAGTIAKYAEEGTRVAVACATRGERGATADLCSIEELPKIREAELRDAMNILGVRDVHILPYEDQKLAEAPLEEIRNQLVKVIRATRPQIVITFDPNGANLHTDHIAISRFTSDAVAAAADDRWYRELGAAHTIERLLWQPPTVIFRYPEQTALDKEPGIDFLIDTAPWSEKKAAAIRAYRTQRLGRLFFDDENGRRTFSSGSVPGGLGSAAQEGPGAGFVRRVRRVRAYWISPFLCARRLTHQALCALAIIRTQFRLTAFVSQLSQLVGTAPEAGPCVVRKEGRLFCRQL